MARKSRSEVFDPHVVGIYHCFNQVVLQQFLLGQDLFTGNDYRHRQVWLEGHMRSLAAAMAIDVLDYGILDNHFHVILRNRPDLVAGWSDEEVVRRWIQVCPGEFQDKDGKLEFTPENMKIWMEQSQGKIPAYRCRLSDISWFMRLAQQRVASAANREQERRGHFWAGRFQCLRIWNLEDLLACSLYVNLDAIRAGLANSPETSVHTSIYDRIRARFQLTAQSLDQEQLEPLADAWLAPLFIDERADAFGNPSEAAAEVVAPQPEESSPGKLEAAAESGTMPTIGSAQESVRARASDKGYLPVNLEDYVLLVTTVAKQLQPNTQLKVDTQLASILAKVQMDAEQWPKFVTRINRLYTSLLGHCLLARIDAKSRK